MSNTDVINQVISSNVRAELARRSLSQTVAAGNLGITPQRLSRCLAGRQQFAVTDLLRLAGLLDVPVTRFFDHAEQVTV